MTAAKHPNAANVAADLLRRLNMPAIGWGDSNLLHQVATALGLEHNGPDTERLVLQRIERHHSGILIKSYTSFPERGLGRVRIFWLPEHAPKK